MASTATIKAIESSTVHQIQSGQVIVDLCSVAKELIENSVDSGATTIEVRFKNQGLDSIEVQDNGSGISPNNYESVALKHYTSKLSSYDDLSTLQTFGFRGEALSSLCALSRFSVVTCTQQEAPRASRLEFETSGKLKSTSVVSGQKGTTVVVEDLFRNLPVRRRELERNIKREWGKVISLLNQYACVQTGVKFTVSQQPTKGKRMVLFSTRGNPTTRENIINVFGVKTMNALISMDLRLELIPTTGPINKGKARADGNPTEIRVLGHVSRPAHGEGRQTPDRQMFYVNGRPCALPQFAKVFNEVYRSYNVSQSPFIFADIQLDTHLYDVNVSPDKRTILLHDQGQMLDNLRESLIELFETQDVTIPVSQAPALKQTPFKSSKVVRSQTPPSSKVGGTGADTVESQQESETSSPIRQRQPAEDEDGEGGGSKSVHDDASDGEEENADFQNRAKTQSRKPTSSAKHASSLSRWLKRDANGSELADAVDLDSQEQPPNPSDENPPNRSDTGEAHTLESDAAAEQTSPNGGTTKKPDYQAIRVRDFHANFTRVEDKSKTDSEAAEPRDEPEPEPPILTIPPPSQPLASRSIPSSSSRPFKRSTEEVATITIGDHTVTKVIGNAAKRLRIDEPSKMPGTTEAGKGKRRSAPLPSFGGRLSQLFSASGRPSAGGSDEIEDVVEDDEDVEGEMDEDEDMDVDVDEDVEEEVNEDEDENVERSPEDDMEEDSLFVSQAEEGGSDIDNDHEGEVEAQSLAPSQAEHSEILGTAGRPLESAEHSPSCHGDHAPEDDEYMDEEEKKAQEDAKVQEMLEAAETGTTEPTEEGEKRSEAFVKGRPKRKDMTLNLVQQVMTSGSEIQQRIAALSSRLPPPRSNTTTTQSPDGLEADDAEEKLSLKITKSDFAKMRIIGQFNLGFILAVREASASPDTTDQPTTTTEDDELFIVDQHASDEKYNFERLQSTTTLQPQRLVQPKPLTLTALEEEIILDHLPALERNGFLIQADTSGHSPVGSRINLLSLPLSRETTFSLSDLEELIVLLADNPTSSATTVPRPSKVRKMFAMRACRSSIMIGRALSRRQMEGVVRHMGEMEKPWNCPHGRPTMRHLCGLGAWEGRGWEEGDGFGGGGGGDGGRGMTDWRGWVREKRGEE